MEDLKLHRFEAEIGGVEVPERLNNPFEYAPHPLAVLAAEQVKRYVRKVFIHKNLGNDIQVVPVNYREGAR